MPISDISLASEKPLSDLIRSELDFASEQYGRMLQQLKGQAGYPRTWEKGNRVLTDASDWTSGFFPGSLWLLFEATEDVKWRDAAHAYTAPLESMKCDRGTHDIGFILYCSFGSGWRLTGNPAYREILQEAAVTLGTRFNPTVGCIKSWDWHPDWVFPVIIDNMMNLELLLWAAREGRNPSLAKLAVRHALTTLRNHFRADASCCHVVDYDLESGRARRQLTYQGLADHSAWARGQGWALYGFTMMYRETRLPEFLTLALRIAKFIVRHPRLPEDLVPLWDFDASPDAGTPRDTSAAAIICSALLELSDFIDAGPAARYRAVAHRQLRSLSSSVYRAALGENGCFLLKHATGHLPHSSEIDVPLNYGDYYYLEALLRARRQLAHANPP